MEILSHHEVNRYYILDNKDRKQRLIYENGSGIKEHIDNIGFKFTNISPKDAKQASFLHSLCNDDIHLSVCVGGAGTGKTLLAVAYAIDRMMTDKTKLWLSKPAVAIGGSKAFGPVPGTLEEKFMPFLSSYEVVLEDCLGNKVIPAQFKDKLSYIPIEYTRGMTFKNCIFILDEAQNANLHQLLILLSRMGTNSKLILLGDIDQVDISNSGFETLVKSNALKKSPICSIIELNKVYRGPLAELSYNIRQELNSR